MIPYFCAPSWAVISAVVGPKDDRGAKRGVAVPLASTHNILPPHSCDIFVVVGLAAAVASAAAVPPVVGARLVEPDLVLELVVGEGVLRLL